MGNSLSPCLHAISTTSRRSSSAVNLIFSNGVTKSLTGNHHIAGEIMFQFPDMMICHADSFFIGHPIPSLAIDDQLLAGRKPISFSGLTYFASFVGVYQRRRSHQLEREMLNSPVKVHLNTFEARMENSRPELQKHYDQLVGSTNDRASLLSPKLENCLSSNCVRLYESELIVFIFPGWVKKPYREHRS
ncbi:hypothetical protein SDJN02_15856, partial [Cucurbita argyrosperma subsp. argyrosperma]